MKYFVLGFVFCFALILPNLAESAEAAYRIVKLKVDVKKAMRDSDGLMLCGDYFVAGESTGGKVIHFSFEEKSTGMRTRMSVFSTIDRIIVSIDEKVKHPNVTIMKDRLGAKLILKMSTKDYMAGLPCLANGIGI